MKDSASITNTIKGEFFTDGETFVFRLADTPLSGVGKSATAAFDDLLRVQGETGPLAERLRELARDQQDEGVRSTVTRMAMVGLIVFGVVGGAVFGAAAILPRVVADTSETVISQIAEWIERMPPERQERLSRDLDRIMTLADPSKRANPPSTDQKR